MRLTQHLNVSSTSEHFVVACKCSSCCRPHRDHYLSSDYWSTKLNIYFKASTKMEDWKLFPLVPDNLLCIYSNPPHLERGVGLLQFELQAYYTTLLSTRNPMF